jgi:hypothetical protein
VTQTILDKMAIWTLAVVALQSLSISALAQSPAPAPIQSPTQSDTRPPADVGPDFALLTEITKQANEAQAQGNELTALDLLRNMERQFADRPHVYRLIAQLSAHLDAAVGNYREALGHFARAQGIRREALRSADEFPLQHLRPEPALGVLDTMADDAQIIMVNEAHHVPQHRAFSIELLPLLWKKGFRYLAAETLSQTDTELQKRGYPIGVSGHYTAEPVYGDLIRTALRLGYRVIPYESTSFKNPEEREQAQAQNLIDRIFKLDPKAKVLIHAGYSHIEESGLLAGVPTLAQRLTQLTGLNPLTIDQTMMREEIAPEYEHPIYQYLIASSPIAQPTLFINAERRPWTLQPGKWDITLFHPRSRYASGRPTWLAAVGRRPYNLPQATCGASRCLVKARLAHESADAIPIDTLEIATDRSPATLMLPPGEFTVTAEDAAGNTLKTLQAKQR